MDHPGEVGDPLGPAGCAARVAASGPSTGSGQAFPGETFRMLKQKEIRDYGEYRPRRRCWRRGGGNPPRTRRVKHDYLSAMVAGCE